MWPGYDGHIYTRDQFVEHVAATTFVFAPKFIVMHATGSPTLAQWMAYPEAQRLVNQQAYYEKQLGWQHGPHLFIGPADICGFSALGVRGTHCSCWNFDSIGIETAGDWNTEDFTDGPGAAVIDNFAFAAAVLHKKLNIRPDDFVLGQSGLHFHRECVADGHFECPHAASSSFTKDWIIGKVLEYMGLPAATVAPQPAPTPLPSSNNARVGSVAWIQAKLNKAGASPPLGVDGDWGPLTRAALINFQLKRRLSVDGIAGPQTLTALGAV